jgi:hypothetical protein
MGIDDPSTRLGCEGCFNVLPYLLRLVGLLLVLAHHTRQRLINNLGPAVPALTIDCISGVALLRHLLHWRP